MSREDTIKLALDYFNQGYACSQSVLLAFADQCKLDPTLAKRISGTFGGGMGRLRQKCGALTGGFMVLGILKGYDKPDDMDGKMASYKLVRELNRRVEEKFGTTQCNELLVKYSTQEHVQERSHHKDICGKIIAETTGELYDMTNLTKF
ncbi:MAG: C-GCAxxG-C-C family protein [Paludibacteraceae bacterium]|nr:C-GCAxxG-C-C family protein [Paludibacteraceae bacterium]